MNTPPLIPHNAPFDPAQRAWLNGLLAGLTNPAEPDSPQTAVAAAPAADPPAPAESDDPYADVDDDELPWHDPALPMDDRLAMVDDKPLPYRLMGAMAQLDCGSCGYLCRSYAQAIADGTEKDLTRCVPGGKDTARQVKKIVKQADENDATPPASDSAPAATAAPADPQAPPSWSRDNPFPAPAVSVAKLTGDRSAKDVRFVSLSIAGSGIDYKVGDSLGVYAKNCYENVDALVRLTGYSGGEPVTLPDGRPSNFREALISHCDIDTPSDELYELLADRATDAKDQAQLANALADKPVDGLLDQPRVIDVLARFRSAAPDPQAIVTHLDALQPRLYSIASSPARYPEEIHLAVGVVRYVMEGQPRKGVASTFLAERLLPHEPVPVYLQPSHGFGLPDDPDRDIIMIGPGTGIAPFRAFLQEREATHSAGRNWLFFGEQHQATDFLFGDELERYRQAGVLTRLTTAFSRDTEEKVYVQHRMLEYGPEIWQWLESGAAFYVCGDASRMAKDVDDALHKILVTHGNRTPEQATEYLQQLTQANRYQRDVY